MSEVHPFECADVNIMGSCNVARTAIDKGVKLVIGISTDAATQPIQNFYGMSKAAMEKVFLSANKLSKTNFLCVRYGNVAWSTGSVFPIWQEMHKKNKMILTTGPYMRRFFFTADDAVDLVYTALKNHKKVTGKILCPEMRSSRMIDILKVWIKKCGGEYNIISERERDYAKTILSVKSLRDLVNFENYEIKYLINSVRSIRHANWLPPVAQGQSRKINGEREVLGLANDFDNNGITAIMDDLEKIIPSFVSSPLKVVATETESKTASTAIPFNLACS